MHTIDRAKELAGIFIVQVIRDSASGLPVCNGTSQFRVIRLDGVDV